MKLVLQYLGFQTIRMTCVLHDRPTHGGVAAHEERDANHPLVSHDGDLRRLTIFHDVEEGDDAVRWKIGVRHRFTGLIQDLTQCQGYELEMVGETGALRGWQAREQGVSFDAANGTSSVGMHGDLRKIDTPAGFNVVTRE